MLGKSTLTVKLDEASKINVFPNPAQANFTVSIYLPSNKNEMSIELYDVLGCLLRKEKLHIGTNIINTEQLSNGVYLFKIVSNGISNKQGKLVIAK